MSKVVDMAKMSQFKSVLRMCDAVELMVERSSDLSERDKQAKYERVSKTRAVAQVKLDNLLRGAV